MREFSKGVPVVVQASAAKTTSGQTGSFGVGNADFVSIFVDVTAVSGTTPTLDIKVEYSFDGTNWFGNETADTFAQINAAKKTAKRVAALGTTARLNYTIGGTTPSFTFAVTALPGG